MPVYPYVICDCQLEELRQELERLKAASFASYAPPPPSASIQPPTTTQVWMEAVALAVV